MSGNAEPPKQRRIFFGWWVLTNATVSMFLNGGLYFYGFSAFFNPLIREFGWSATALSGAFSLSRLETGIAGPLVGFLIDRIGTRGLVAAGFGITGVGFILLAQVNSIEMFYVVFVVLISAGSSLGFYGPASATVANWFDKKRSLALGIMMSGVGLGGIAVPGLAWLIGQQGWRATATASGLLFLAAGIPVAVMMRHKPEPYGLLPDGRQRASSERADGSVVGAGQRLLATAQAEAGMSTATDIPQKTRGFSPREALATSTFWVVSFVFTLRQVVTAGVAVHEVPALENMGLSPEGAGGILAAMTVLSIPGRLGFGWLADRYDIRYITGVGLILQFVGLIFLAYASDMVAIVIFLLIYSPAYGGLIPLMPASYGLYFGRESFASILGMAQTVMMIGTISGPLLAGYTFDVSGNYQFAFLFFAATNIVGVFLLFFIKLPQRKLAHEAVAA